MTETSDQIWRQFESLLEEAVMRNHYAGVEILLNFESVGCLATIPRYKPRNYIPLILAIEQAIEKKDVSIVNVFRKHSYTLPEPHPCNCDCNSCIEDKLGQTKSRLMKVRALANPVWISIASNDPFISLFELAKWNREFGEENISFLKEYGDAEKIVVGLSSQLLDEVRSEKEGSTIMRHKTVCQDNDFCYNLSFVAQAIEYNQKEVVAHPVVQHFLYAAVFDKIPGWRTGGLIYKTCLVIFLALAYPITSVLNIICPTWECIGSLGKIAMNPFVKFVNGAASFITFLVLLGVLSANEDMDGIRGGQWPPNGTEMAVFVWLIGFCFGECRQVSYNLMHCISDIWVPLF